ncbi:MULTISPECIES: hypothetical protein [unclassified Paenibacillus]|uniref:hypothetical protein n=1 Tax=unclassified Paenibacillus TaxID=185978 RepID=UPI00104CB8B0|nr:MULTISPECIES: hypothetical protein [unclassified Paenibacillus]NIK68184.1 hypothetical protein [Paenibacillus sp. BK720]TCM99599.1 hypothetical protein EV294_102905 [Paenibacillus sp. BK033]
MAILDSASVNILPGTYSLPLPIPPGTEIMLTSLFLKSSSPDSKNFIEASVCWRAEPSQLSIVPKIILRLRRGGVTAAFPEVSQIADSCYCTNNTSARSTTTTFYHVESPEPGTSGLYQSYYLTAESAGIGRITITGPIDLKGTTIGYS